MNRRVWGSVVVGAAVAIGAAWMQPAERDAGKTDPAEAFATMLMDALNQIEGCLGTDAAKFKSGKTVIVAWFKNKAAVEAWYNHPTHVMMMRGIGTNPADFKPLEHVKDSNTPVMVMASMTIGGETTMPGPMPFSQISIEMYTPLPGGAMVNGRLAPKAFPIPQFDDLGAGEQP